MRTTRHDRRRAPLGTLLGQIAPPLALGPITLDDGTVVPGFVAQHPVADAGTDAEDITAFGGWRAFRAARIEKAI